MTFRFDRAPEMLALLRRELAHGRADAVLLAVDGAGCRAGEARTSARVAAYASSQVNERQPREALRDLEDVRFVEIPWLADARCARRSRALPARDYANAALDRLYALGIDAFRVAQAFADGRADDASSSTAPPDT